VICAANAVLKSIASTAVLAIMTINVKLLFVIYAEVNSCRLIKQVPMIGLTDY
jgi:hypothetical protein